MGASPGNFGTILSQAAWLPILRTLGMRATGLAPRCWCRGPVPCSMPAGQLTDQDVAKKLGEFLQGFAAFAAKK